MLETMDLQKLALLILVVSGLNIGACAVFDKDPLRTLLGKSFAQIFAAAVGLAALYFAMKFFGAIEGFNNPRRINYCAKSPVTGKKECVVCNEKPNQGIKFDPKTRAAKCNI